MSNKGRVWSVDAQGGVYRWADGGWVKMARDETAAHISVGASGVWLIDSDNRIYYRTETYGDVDTAGSEVSGRIYVIQHS